MKKVPKKQPATKEVSRYNGQINRIAKILRETTKQFQKGGLTFDIQSVPDSRLLARNIVENGL